MRRFEAACLVVFAALIGVSAAQADDASGLRATTPEERAAYQTHLMTGMLALTPEQVERVGAVNLEYARQLDPLLKGDQSRYERYKKATPILDAKDAAIEPLLSADQYRKYLDSKKTVQKDLETHFADHGAATQSSTRSGSRSLATPLLR